MSPNKPDLYIGSFYRPPSAGDSPLIELEATLTNLPVDKTIILGGDFNCREIDWVRLTSNGPSHCHKLLDICNDFSLNQMNDKPTRLGSILELHLTNNPSLVRNCSIASGFSDHDGMIVHLVTLCRRVASDSWRQPWQLLSIPLYLWHIVSWCWWWLRSNTPWVCLAIFV